MLYQGAEIPRLRLQYKDFSGWQNSRKHSETLTQQEQYWLKQFPGEIPVLNLVTDYPRPEIKSFKGSIASFEIEPAAERALREYAREQGTTLFMVLLAIYMIFLSKISGQEDIVVGTPIAGRHHAHLEKIIGMFVNTLALRNYPTAGKTFKQFLQEIKENSLQALANQDYQFDDLVNKISKNRDMNRNPLFDAMFVLQNLNETRKKASKLVIKEYEDVRQASIVDLNLSVMEAEEGLVFWLQYCTELFKKETIERYFGYIQEIISAVIENKEVKLAEISISYDLIAPTANAFKEDFGEFGF